jgi:hypothetical protein
VTRTLQIPEISPGQSAYSVQSEDSFTFVDLPADDDMGEWRGHCEGDGGTGQSVGLSRDALSLTLDLSPQLSQI